MYSFTSTRPRSFLHGNESSNGFGDVPAVQITVFVVILAPSLNSTSRFADLIVHKHYINVEKIIVYYIVGIGVSVMLPMVLTLGAVTPADLLAFSNLPPVVGEVAEMVVATVQIAVEAVALHVGLRMLGYRGSLKLMFVSLLFIHAFFQVFDRPYDYFVSGPLVRYINDTDKYLRFLNELSKLRWALFAYFLFPFIYYVYRAGPKAAATAYLAVFVVFFAVQAVASGTISPYSMLEQARLDQVLEQDNRLIEEYKEKVIPLAEAGDQTQDYSAALSNLESLIHRLEKLDNEAGAVAERLKGSNRYFKAQSLQKVVRARRELFISLGRVMRGELDAKQTEEFAARLKEAIETYQGPAKNLNNG